MRSRHKQWSDSVSTNHMLDCENTLLPFYSISGSFHLQVKSALHISSTITFVQQFLCDFRIKNIYSSLKHDWMNVSPEESEDKLSFTNFEA